MKINHLILENFYKVFGNLFTGNPKFRILNVHDILEKDFDNLEKVLLSLKKNWEFVDPSKIHMISEKPNKNYILLTFDDGYKSQKFFADKILNKHNIKSIFFVITNFLNINNQKDAKNFVLKNIDTNIDKDKLRYDEVNNMNFEDILNLRSNNHLIGSHTVNHKRLTDITNPQELEFEIYNSKKEIEIILNCPIDNFAYTYGDIDSINQNVLALLQKYYKQIFSGIRGNNFNFKSSTIFLRDELTPTYSQELVNSFLCGYSDPYYYKNRRKLLSYENSI